MKKMRLWARAPRWLAVLAWLTIGASVALPAGAQPYSTWERPGRHPFTGTPEEACGFLSVGTGITMQECLQGARCLDSGGGQPYYFKDGEILITTMTKDGVHSAPTLVVAFKNEQSWALPPDHPDRLAMTCSLGRADGLQLARAQACGNWTVVRVPPTPPLRTKVAPSTHIEEPPLWLRGVVIPNCCNCGPGYQYIPGLMIDQSDQVNSGPTMFQQFPTQ